MSEFMASIWFWGAAVALLLCVWLFMLLGHQLVGAVPARQVNEYHDAPPRYWAMLGWVGHALAYWVKSWIPASWRSHLQDKLRVAGLEYSLVPELFVAGQIAAGVVSGLVLLLIWFPRGWSGVLVLILVSGFSAALPVSWLRDQGLRRKRQISKAFPFYLDIITLAIEAGSNMTGSFQHAVDKGPGGPLADELRRVLRDIRAGRSRAEAVRALADRLNIPAVSNWVAAILTAEKQGASLGPILRAQADQRRNERFMQAEAMALKAPVKMLFPLITCIFPCTFIIVFFPIAIRIMGGGLL